MLIAKRKANISDDPMSIAQVLRNEHINDFMTAFAEEVSSLKTTETFMEYIGKPSDIRKGFLLSSKKFKEMIS